MKNCKPNLSEGQLKRQVDEYLTYKQNAGELLFLRLNSGDFIDTRGGTRRRIRGCPKGTADFEVIIKERQFVKWVDACTYEKEVLVYCKVVFLELKSDTGKQSEEQKDFHDVVEKLGCSYHIIRSIEELESVIKEE